VTDSDMSVSSSNVASSPGDVAQGDGDSPVLSGPGVQTRVPGGASNLRGASDVREPADVREQGLLFRALMDSPMTARQLAELATFKETAHESGVDVAAMLHAQQTIDQGPGYQPAAAAGAPDPSIADLIEKHVRRALASVETRSSTDGEVRIELSDAVFPGTELSLKRTEDGWQLTATADNRQSLEKLNHFTPALVERFARASLGRLRVALAS
jgi:hypothetical protein